MFGNGLISTIIKMEYESVVERALSRLPEGFKLSVVWWNTGMRALRKELEGTEPSHTAQINKLERKLLERQGVVRRLIRESDILILGEYINEFGLTGDVARINFEASKSKCNSCYSCVDLYYEASGKMIFDNYVVYNKNKLYCVPQSIIERTVSNVGTRRKERRYKAYQCVKFDCVRFTNKSLDVFVVHWNMRDGFGGNEKRAAKLKAAELLAKKIEPAGGRPFKIVAGDFNNEPYEESLMWLESSRSRDYVSTAGGLYNPFWKYLNEEARTIYSPKNHEFMANGAIFDGILVNRAFVERSDQWRITPSILEARFVMDVHDHNPVKLVLEH